MLQWAYMSTQYRDILRQRPEVISAMCQLCEAMMDIYQFSKKSGGHYSWASVWLNNVSLYLAM